MKAMIFAAGLGTRLRPLTNNRPKALVQVAGRTLLEITITRLKEFGVSEIIVNVHHFADMVVAYLKANNNFGIRVAVSREEQLLDTGGGLKQAAWFFREGSNLDDPFFLHNVDVVSTIDLALMLKLHRERQPLATLAVQKRQTSRALLFDDHARLCGRRPGKDGDAEMERECDRAQAYGFSGIHVISPRIFSAVTGPGAFSIIDSYLRLAGKGEPIQAFRADEYFWRDLGRPENIAQTERDFKDGILS